MNNKKIKTKKNVHTKITDYLNESVVDTKCDCCKYFDFKSLEKYDLFENPLYAYIEKRTDISLVYMSPKEYLVECAKANNIPYDKYISSSAISKERYEKYAEDMKNGSRFPIGFYCTNASQQEGRHRALAAMILGCDKIPVVKITYVNRQDVIDCVMDYKDMSRSELNDRYVRWGYKGITDLDWKSLQDYIRYSLD